MVKAIIFDFTGVLRTDALELWLTQHGLKKNDEMKSLSAQQDLGEISNAEFYEQISKLFGYQMTPDINTPGKLNFELIDFISDLKKQYKVALLSNSPLGFVRSILKDNNLELLFDEVIISSELHVAKPNPEIFKIALDRLGIDEPEAIFVDDNIEHIDAAHQLGITSIQFISLKKLKNRLNDLGVNI